MGTSIVPEFSVELAGETRQLRYGFRAFKELGLNPFQPKGMVDYTQSFDADTFCAWVRAGLLWEYAKGQPRHGQDPPTVDDLIDLLGSHSVDEVFSKSLEVAGLKSDGNGDGGEPSDPPKA